MNLRGEGVPLQFNSHGDAVHWRIHSCLSILSRWEPLPKYRSRRYRFVISRSINQIGSQRQRIFDPLPAWTDNPHLLQRTVSGLRTNLRVVAEGRPTRNAAAPTGPAEDRLFSCHKILCVTRNIHGWNVADLYMPRGGAIDRPVYCKTRDPFPLRQMMISNGASGRPSGRYFRRSANLLAHKPST